MRFLETMNKLPNDFNRNKGMIHEAEYYSLDDFLVNRPQSCLQGRGLALAIVLVENHLGPVKIHAALDLTCVMTKNHGHVLNSCAVEGPNNMLQESGAAIGEQGFIPPHAGRFAGGKDQPCDHVGKVLKARSPKQLGSAQMCFHG